MSGSPTVQRRRLSAELIRLRQEAGLTAEEVSERLEWSRGRLHHMETNKWVRPDLGNIRALLDVYSVTDEQVRDAILDLARRSREKGCWAKYSDVFRGSLPGFEADATQIRAYDGMLINGLLQTANYAAAVFRGGQVLGDEAVKRRVEARLARQDVLHRPDPPSLWTIVDEAALRKLVGGKEVMVEQLRHLIEMAARPNITLQIVPDSVGAHAGTAGSFILMDFAADLDPSVVYLETATDSLYLEKAEELNEYTLIFTRVVASAMTPEESIRYAASLVDQLNR
ncbi:Helix-turn-helix domain-containing protein [Streptosporangium canum]|uniref:Helix-turn-helix domain-containing protein n=1 Tax=Streptosporangium canum TaxID=324952 RepID=A0A1I4DHW6_9ACTN|nr:helix-turn-helix transcriptional regulator [Streptosporangium canum]SFK93208.1 Helix-turn-helix domain-containing protein [Streptosporangium canum]